MVFYKIVIGEDRYFGGFFKFINVEYFFFVKDVFKSNLR